MLLLSKPLQTVHHTGPLRLFDVLHWYSNLQSQVQCRLHSSIYLPNWTDKLLSTCAVPSLLIRQRTRDFVTAAT